MLLASLQMMQVAFKNHDTMRLKNCFLPPSPRPLVTEPKFENDKFQSFDLILMRVIPYMLVNYSFRNFVSLLSLSLSFFIGQYGSATRCEESFSFPPSLEFQFKQMVSHGWRSLRRILEIMNEF